MDRMLSSSRRILLVALAAALSLLLVVSALAAHPKAGKRYSGFTTEEPFNGFKPPVSFKVSKNGKQVRGFKWAGRKCGIGGTGNQWPDPSLNYKVKKMKVSRRGKFSIKKSKYTYTAGSDTVITTSTVKGRFKTRKKATGTIKFTHNNVGVQSCHGTVKFTATR